LGVTASSLLTEQKITTRNNNPASPRGGCPSWEIKAGGKGGKGGKKIHTTE